MTLYNKLIKNRLSGGFLIVSSKDPHWSIMLKGRLVVKGRTLVELVTPKVWINSLFH